MKKNVVEQTLAWADNRITTLYNVAKHVKHPITKRLYHDNAIALEEEFLEWIHAIHSGISTKALVFRNVNVRQDDSDSKDS